jgi:RNA polymerase sigma factor (sigma-70 family)
MANKIHPLHGFVRKALNQCRDQQASDRELLHRFITRRDESAFAALVRRHSAMVLGVGLRVLHHQQDAEDVCQATFLRLAQKAKVVPWRASIANWLYGTAYRFCLQVRDAARRRNIREAKVRPKALPDAMADISLRELEAVLDQELARLPRKYGAPLLLCCLEGKARDEAAQCLGWPLAMVKSRLEEGRELLRRRLARRGLALSAVLGGVTLTSGSARAALSAVLVRATSRAALQVVAGQMAAGIVSPKVATLVEGTVQTMFLTKLKVAGALLLIVGAMAAGVIALTPDTHVAARVETPAPAATPSSEGNDALPARALARLGTTRWRHGGYSGFVAFLPDGKGVVSASADQVFHVWEFPSGKEIRRFGPGLDAPLPPAARLGRTELPVALSADGKTAACHFDVAELRLYDVATGKEVASLPQRGNLSTVAFSPDNRHVAARDWIGELTIWDWKAGKTQKINVPHRLIIGETPTLAYAPDGTVLAMTSDASDGSTIQLVDPRKAVGEQVRTITVDPGVRVRAVLFSPDSKLVAWTGGSTVVNLLDVATGKQVRQIRGPERVGAAMAFSRDGKSIITRPYNRRPVREWDVGTGKELRNFGPVGTEYSTGHGLPRPALSPDGTILAFAGIDHALQFLDLRTGKEVHAVGGNAQPLLALGFAANGKQLWTQSSGKQLRQWEWPSGGKELDAIPLPIDSFNAALSGDGRYMATAPTRSKPGQLIRIADGQRVGQIPPRPQLNERELAPATMVFSPDGALLAIRWQATQELEVYAVPEGKLAHKQRIAAPDASMGLNFFAAWTSMLFSPDGRLLTAYSAPGILSFWDATTGHKRGDIPLPDKLPLAAAAFAPDCRSLAVEKGAGSMMLLELATGKQRRIFVARDVPGKKTKSPSWRDGTFWGPFAAPAVNVAFSPDGTLLVLGGADGVIHVWNVHSGEEPAVFRGHSGIINAFAFTADGKTLASASADTSVLTWDLSAWASRPIPKRVLSDAELHSRWADLAGADAEKAFTAMCDLAAASAQAAPFLNQRLRPASPIDQDQVSRQLADLGSSVFKVREKAITDLMQQGEQVVPLIDKALAAAPPLEVRLRLQKLRDQFTGLLLKGDDLRQSRALEVLERIGTRAACKLLERIAGGAPAALTTKNAQAALGRLAKANAAAR